MEQDNTVVLQSYNSVQEATIAKDRLKAQGIESFLKNENVMGLDPIAGVELKIFVRDIDAARLILDSV